MFRRQFFPSCLKLAGSCAAAAAASASAAPMRFQATTATADGSQFTHITHNLVWGLWNDGNLFSLSTAELQHFLSTVDGLPPAGSDARKSALVRLVEEVLSAEQQKTKEAAPAVVISDYDRVDEALDDADEYGDWGCEPGSDKKRSVDFIEISPSRMGERFDPLIPRSFQLLHSDVTGDLQLHRVNPSKLPGQSKRPEALVASAADVDASNAMHFRKALEWCLLNIWNLNVPGELNIGAGKCIYYRNVAKQSKNVLPLWSVQKHLYAQHPYAWFAIASESNISSMESLAAKMGLLLLQEPTTSYKVMVKRMGETLDLELNDSMQCVKVNRPWDRFLVSHYVRSRMPDLRYLVRVRHPIKKRVTDAYLESDILRKTRDSVQSVLSPELGDVHYCCERTIRKWGRRTESGVMLYLVETRRVPLIITRVGDEGERLEYEWIVQLPQKAERIDVAALSAELWGYGNTLASALEEGMEDLMAHRMSSTSLSI